MRGGIDAAGEARCNSKSRPAEFARQPLGDFHAGGRSVARADNRDQRRRQHVGIAADRQQRRRVVDHLQPARIVRLAERDQRNAELGASLELPLGLFVGANLWGAGAAAARQVRQRRERRTRSAEMIEQRAKSARPHILAADEA